MRAHSLSLGGPASPDLLNDLNSAPDPIFCLNSRP